MHSRPDNGESNKVVWLFGHPVGHSLSAAIHNAAFRYTGVDMRYVARDVPETALAEAVSELRSDRARGANLTLPHKVAALALLDGVDPEAQRIGAVNTIVNEAGCLFGHNTDLGGFLRALQTVMADGVRGLCCLVLGAGGAARAVVAGLSSDGAEQVWVANRDLEKAKALCGDASTWGDTRFVPLALEEAATVAANCQVVVNATSLGLSESVKNLPIDVDILHSGQVLLDLVYRNGLTALVRAAKAKGLAAIDGKEMLVQQAALSFELWTGLSAPLSVMRGSISDC